MNSNEVLDSVEVGTRREVQAAKTKLYATLNTVERDDSVGHVIHEYIAETLHQGPMSAEALRTLVDFHVYYMARRQGQ